MMNDELTLIKISYIENAMGDSIKVEDRTDILCSVESVTRSEHYAAAKHDIVPEVVFVINKYDYDKQQQIEYDGDPYNVIRTYMPKSGHNNRDMIEDIDKLELVCEGGD